ncbi:translocation/assembly module TamB domain-containing protein [Jiulongibacter sp. NS-SX5]|uniref:translocation/assembly module TamB domain-containing protein n=1 Tax=Jiulongibacter sp. NS-SX5 TaxID=3463854 RepID=UPI00405A49E5
MNKFLRIIGWILAVIIVTMLALAFYIQSGAGQRTVQNQLNKFVGNKLSTPFRVGEVKYSIPDWVILRDVYVEDLQKDTLVAAGEVRIDLDMFSLLRGALQVNTLELTDGNIKLYTPENTSDFNYQFLIDAFAGETDTLSVDTTSSGANPFVLDEAILKKTRFLYKENTSGIDFSAEIGKGEVDFSDFDINGNLYAISDVEVDNLKANLITAKPTFPVESETSGDPVQLKLGNIDITRLYWAYNGKDTGIENTISAMAASVAFDELDLEEQHIYLDRFVSENADVKVIMKQGEVSESGAESKPWIVKLGTLDFDGGSIQYTDQLANPVLVNGEFNTSDIRLSNAELNIEDFYYDGAKIEAKVRKVIAKERSGLAIDNLALDLVYTDQLIGLRNLNFKSPRSNFKGDIVLGFNSLDEFTADPLKSKISFEANKARLALTDIYKFNAELSQNPALASKRNEVLLIDGKLKSNQDNFLLEDLILRIDQETGLALNGFAGGIGNLEKLKANLTIKELKTSKGFYQDFLPDSLDLSGYNLPEMVNLSGSIKGNARAMNLDAVLNTDLGKLTLNGLLKNAGSDSLRSYTGYLATDKLNLNKFYAEGSPLGELTAELELTANSTLDELKAKGQIAEMVYNEYTYKEIDLDANFIDSVLVFKGRSDDTNLDFNADFKADFNREQPAFDGRVNLQKANLSKLNLSAYEGDITGDFLVKMNLYDKAYLLGTADIKGLQLSDVKVGDLKGKFSREGSQQRAEIKSGFMNARLKAEGGILNLAESFAALTADSTGSVTDEELSRYNFELTGSLTNNPIWGALAEGLYFEDPITFAMSSNGRSLDGNLKLKQLAYNDLVLTGWSTELSGGGKIYKTKTSINDLRYGEGHLINNTLLANFENEVLDIDFTSENKKGDLFNKVALTMNTAQSTEVFELEKLMFKGERFTVNEHQIRIYQNKLLTDGLILESGNQKLSLLATEQDINLAFTDFDLEPFYSLLYGEAVDLHAFLNGEASLKNNFEEISGKANLSIKDVKIDDQEIGELSMDIPQFSTEKVTLIGKVNGPSSKANFNGSVILTGDGKLDMAINLDRLDAALVKAFSAGQITEATGELYGKIKLTSTLTDPEPNGNLGFRNFDVTPSYLGVPLLIDNQEIRFKNKSVFLDNFTVKDSTDQQLVFDGSLNWSDLNAISYQMDLKTSDFLLLNTVAEDNDLVYGTLKLDADLRLKGVGEKPNVDGKVKIREDSDLTFVMPADIETAETQGIVYFVPPKDSVTAINSTAPRDTVSAADAFAEVVNEILIAVETEEDAQFTIIVDEINGDNLVFSGTSNLTYGLYPNGQQYLIGSFDLTQGVYSFSFEVFKRQFQVQKGSKLTWSGDPFQAEMDITAAYQVRTDIQSLNAFGLNSSAYGKVPLDVLLKLTGSLEEPDVNFDLQVSDKAENSVKSLIKSNDVFASLRNNSSEMNQQVFSLILFNRFLSGSFLSFSGNSFSGESVARQSVSKLLTEQLNNLASNVLGDVGLSLGLDSDVADTGARTEFNLGLNQSFLNNRIRVSLGKNFELANTTGVSRSSTEVLDNVNIEYLVTPDGRYVVKVYRDNEYQTVLEGFVVETGVGFELRADYDKVSELFKKRAK